MNAFIHDDFLLSNRAAKSFYHDYARHLPIVDFHNHLMPQNIAEDRKFDSITQLWLEGDHYKWRAMRACGVNERFITGQSSDWEKFRNWAAVVPKMLLNPLYHWSHLELMRYFEMNVLLNESNARYIFDTCNSKITAPEYSVRNLLRKMNVEYLCSTEDPTDSLKWHKVIAKDFEITVTPAFRPDKILNISDNAAFINYIQKLESATQMEIHTYTQLCLALEARHEFFNAAGCHLSDIALDWFRYMPVSNAETDRIFKKALVHKEVTQEEADAFRTSILIFLCTLNHGKQWIQQFHLGALRNINLQGKRELGEATGFDAMNDQPYIAELGKLLNILQMNGTLAKSIFFNLNPRDNAALLTLIQSFNDGSTEGKMQYGPAWWFLDQKEGIEQHLRDTSVFGVLGVFVGMITDSRSFLSFPRHEYFRRVLCNFLGAEVEKGTIPRDNELLKNTIENVCYYNAKKYLNVADVNMNTISIQ